MMARLKIRADSFSIAAVKSLLLREQKVFHCKRADNYLW
jgi:hypothetical protein